MTAPQIHVINLDRSVERLSAMASQLDTLPCHWTRMRAVEPTTVADHPLYRGQRARTIRGQDLRIGELGCFLSHLACIDAFLLTDEPTAVVLEDDVVIDAATLNALQLLPDQLAKAGIRNWDCVNLSSRYAKRRSFEFCAGPYDVYRAWQFPLLTSALMWSRAGAAAFRASVHRSGIFMAVDNQLRAVMTARGRGLSLDPPLVRLAAFPSTIDETPAACRRVHRLSLRGLRQTVPLYCAATFNRMRPR